MGTLLIGINIGTTHCLNKVTFPIRCGNLKIISPPKYLSYNQLTTTETIHQTPATLITKQGISSGELAASERFWWRA